MIGLALSALIFGLTATTLLAAPSSQQRLESCIAKMREASRGSMTFSDPFFGQKHVFQSADFLARNCPYGCEAASGYDIWTVHILSDGKPGAIICQTPHRQGF